MPAAPTPKGALLCTVVVGVAAVFGHLPIQGAFGGPSYAYTDKVAFESVQMGYTTITSLSNTPYFFAWGVASCNDRGDGKKFAPPHSEAARVAYNASFSGGNIVNGFVGIKYNASGDAPKYYVADGRFKDCLYAGYPFGDMSSWWDSGVITQTEGDVAYRNGLFEVVPVSTSTDNNAHCATYICNNNDDCFGNGLGVSGNWPSCNCGGCDTGTSGDNCNIFTIGDVGYTVHPSLTYGTVASMRAVCEASGKSLFSNTTDKAGWDLLQTYIPPTFRFYVDLTDVETQSTWKNSNGVIFSEGSTFAAAYYGEWYAGEGTNTTGGRCVDMVGGKLYQTACSGNRYFMCVDGAAVTTTTTTTTTTSTTTSSGTTSTTTTTATTSTTPTSSTTTTSFNTTTSSNNTNTTREGGAAGLVSMIGVAVAMVTAAILF